MTRIAPTDAAKNRDEQSLVDLVAGEQPPVVALKRPRCPRCRSLKCNVYKTGHDGEVLIQRRRCAVCQLVFIAICD